MHSEVKFTVVVGFARTDDGHKFSAEAPSILRRFSAAPDVDRKLAGSVRSGALDKERVHAFSKDRAAIPTAGARVHLVTVDVEEPDDRVKRAVARGQLHSGALNKGRDGTA